MRDTGIIRLHTPGGTTDSFPRGSTPSKPSPLTAPNHLSLPHRPQHKTCHHQDSPSHCPHRMRWLSPLALTLLLLYPLPIIAPFPPAPHRNGWHPDKPLPGMILHTPRPRPKKPVPYKKVFPYGTKCARPNVIGAEQTGLMIDYVDGYPACFVRLPFLFLFVVSCRTH